MFKRAADTCSAWSWSIELKHFLTYGFAPSFAGIQHTDDKRRHAGHVLDLRRLLRCRDYLRSRPLLRDEGHVQAGNPEQTEREEIANCDVAG